MNALLVVPVAVPLAGAAVALLARGRRDLQRVVSAACVSTVLAAGVALVAVTRSGRLPSMQMGAWRPGIAIPFVADPLAALLVTVAAGMALACVALAMARGEDGDPLLHPLVLVLLAGAFGAFLTADLFNLFVFFEVMLASSYVLLSLGRGRAVARAASVYVTVSLLASTLLLVGIALLYGVTGSVNLGELHRAAASADAALAAGVIALAFAVKAGVVPVHGWLPRTYPHASPAVTALFSGLLTKAGVYALYRLWAVVYGGEPVLAPLVLAVVGSTMVVGVLGAIGRGDVRGILSFHMVSQVGYLLVPLGVVGAGALAAGIFYLVQYIVVKGSLLLSAGAVEALEGSGRLARLGGVARTRPVLALAFGLAAMSLAGLPPLSGFFAKALLVSSAFSAGRHGIAAVMVVVSLFTLLSMVKIWNGVFWGERVSQPVLKRRAELVPVPAGGSGDFGSPPVSRRRAAALVAPALVTAALTVGVGVWPEGLYSLALSAADALTDPGPYLEAVRRP